MLCCAVQAWRECELGAAPEAIRPGLACGIRVRRGFARLCRGTGASADCRHRVGPCSGTLRKCSVPYGGPAQRETNWRGGAMESLVHTAFDCGGELVPVFSYYGQGMPRLEFECEKCGRYVGRLDNVTLAGNDATPENVEYAGEVQ